MFQENVQVLIAAGGSGNDSKLLTLGHPSVIVGNAHPELQCLEETSYVYKAKHKYAAGIKEA